VSPGPDPITTVLVEHHNLIIALHILAIIAWMAGLLYLPRLFVYHTRATPGSEMDATFQEMERKLLQVIMNPAMILAWVLGLTLIWIDSRVYGQGVWGPIGHFLSRPWMAVKFAGVVFQTGWHHYLAIARKRFARGQNQRPEKYWRMVNELPFLAAIIMVLAVTTKFGGW
jgi:putative membrane protein